MEFPGDSPSRGKSAVSRQIDDDVKRTKGSSFYYLRSCVRLRLLFKFWLLRRCLTLYRCPRAQRASTVALMDGQAVAGCSDVNRLGSPRTSDQDTQSDLQNVYLVKLNFRTQKDLLSITRRIFFWAETYCSYAYSAGRSLPALRQGARVPSTEIFDLMHVGELSGGDAFRRGKRVLLRGSPDKHRAYKAAFVPCSASR